MKTGIVPSSWLDITDKLNARHPLALLHEVNRRGIAHNGLVAVKAVWIELTRGFARLDDAE